MTEKTKDRATGDAPVLLGPFLRQLRTTRRLTQARLAEQAHISRLTLLRWESGQTAPRLPELKTLLFVLRADAIQTRTALEMLRAPRGMRAVREAALGSAPDAIGLPIGQGDLLRAMRMRRRISLETLAGALGVSASTVSRWEQGYITPPTASLHRLMMLLKVHPAERDVLLGNPFFPVERSAPLRERWEAFEKVLFSHTQDALLDLGFLALETDAWERASRPDSRTGDHHFLALLFARHADSLLVFRRYREAQYYAERALALTAPHSPRDAVFTRAVVVAADSAVYQRARPAPLRGLEILRDWLPVERLPAFANWIMVKEAAYLALLGRKPEALSQVEEACRRSDNPLMLRLRQRDLAQALLRAGRAEEALPLIHAWSGASPSNRVQTTLLRAACLHAMHQPDDAAAHLADATAEIERHDLHHLKAEVDKMALQSGNRN